MSTYAEKLRDPRWQKKRLAILERDGFKCRDCGAENKTLSVHHCHYSRGNPWDTEDSLLLTLCDDCHEIRGKLESTAKKALAIILSRMGCSDDDDELKVCVNDLVLFAKHPGKRMSIWDHDKIVELYERASLH